MPRLLIINLLSVINERVIFIGFRTDSCMHVWMFMCRPIPVYFCEKIWMLFRILIPLLVKLFLLFDVISLLFLALLVYVFLSFLATSLLRCCRSECWFLLGVLFRSFYLLVLCLVYCSLLYDPFVSFYLSIVLRHHSIILFVVCVYLCMYHFPLWTCNSVLWLWISSCRSVMPVYYHYYYYCYIDININLKIRDRVI